MSDTPRFNTFSGLGGFTTVTIVDTAAFTPNQFEAEVHRIEKETGHKLGTASNTGLPSGKVRLTFLPRSDSTSK